MTITAEQMNELATSNADSIFHREVDEAIVRIEKSIQERAEHGEKTVVVNLGGLCLRALDLIFADLKSAGFNFAIDAGQRVMITW